MLYIHIIIILHIGLLVSGDNRYYEFNAEMYAC